MEYFHMGIFVISRVYLIRKYGSQTQAFFLYFIDFSTPCHKDKADALKQERIKGLERMVLNFYLRFKNCQLIMTRKKDLLIFSWDCILPKYRYAMDFCLYTSYTTIRYKVQIVSFGYKFQPICLKFCMQA